MSETTKELVIESVEGPNEKGWYTAHTKEGHKYGTKNEDIIKFRGVTATFKTNSVKNGKYWTNYLNDPLPDLPKGSTVPESTPTSNDSHSKSDLILIAYAKDFAIAFAPSHTPDQALELMEKAFKKMNEIIAPEIPF